MIAKASTDTVTVVMVCAHRDRDRDRQGGEQEAAAGIQAVDRRAA